MSKTVRKFPFLYSVVGAIEKHKVHIATVWVKRENINHIFNDRKISPKKFRDGYGVPILEYFISVIKEEKPLGDCPIMSKLVHYLLKKDITPQEVFNICMDLRSSLREYLFAKDAVKEDPLKFLTEVATIMDANLSGVLGIFTNVYKNTKEEVLNLLNEQEKLLEEKEKLEEDTSVDKLTGLLSYRAFEKTLQEKTHEYADSSDRLFIVLLDIPKLRDINISKGQEAGDKIVKDTAALLRDFEDTLLCLARISGGRFGILLEFSKEQEAYDWCIELYKSMPDLDEKVSFCVSEVDSKESLGRLFIRVNDLIDEANVKDSIIVNTDFINIVPYQELSDQSEFTNELKKLTNLETFAYYKELPITNNSKLLTVNQNSIEISASEKQLKILKVGDFVYFKSKELGNVKANVQSMDKDRGRMILYSFRFDIHSPLDRKLYRVKAADDFRGYIRDNNRDYDVKILDMNSSYIAMKIDRKRNFDLDASFRLYIRMIIDEVAHNFETNGVIERLEKVPGGYKFIVRCDLDTSNEEILQDYVASFQRNIIKDFQA